MPNVTRRENDLKYFSNALKRDGSVMAVTKVASYSEDICLQTLTSFSITWITWITWLAKELSSRSNPLRADEFPTRFSAGVDTRISFKL